MNEGDETLSVLELGHTVDIVRLRVRDRSVGGGSIWLFATRSTSLTESTIKPVVLPAMSTTTIRFCSVLSLVAMLNSTRMSITGKTLPRRLMMPLTWTGALGSAVIWPTRMISCTFMILMAYSSWASRKQTSCSSSSCALAARLLSSILFP